MLIVAKSICTLFGGGGCACPCLAVLTSVEVISLEILNDAYQVFWLIRFS